MTRHRYAFFLLGIFLFTGCGSNSPTSSTTTTPTVSSTTAAFTTSDGFALQGAWYTPITADGVRPVVILLEALNGSYTDWSPVVSNFVTKGYVVLAFDSRGQGLSVYKNAVLDPVSTFSDSDFNQMPQDVEAAISWIGTQSNVDTTRIGLVGVDIGANIAFVSSGIDPRIKAAVCISGEYQQGQSILAGAGIADFHPHNILYLADYGDDNAFSSAQAMANLTEGNKQVVAYYGTDHGYLILNYTDAWNQIFNWLQSNL